MIESFALVTKEIAKSISEAVVDAGKREVFELPDKIGMLSEVESLPDKVELVSEEDLSISITRESKHSFSGEHEAATTNDSGNESDYPSSYKERIDRTPRENSDRGKWTGDRGESTFISSDEEMQKLLAQFGLDGIEYKDGIPDFSKCSACTVGIDNMSENRYGKDGNFAQCDSKCAEQWNNEGRAGKTDRTARDVKEWREINGYSWHERNDMKTCDLIPTEINDYFGHLGGVAECKKCNADQYVGGDGFDD